MAPPTGPKRIPIPVRLRPSSVEWLDKLASETGMNRSDVVRAALAVAVTHEREVRAGLGRQA